MGKTTSNLVVDNAELKKELWDISNAVNAMKSVSAATSSGPADCTASKEKYPAKSHARTVAKHLKEKNPDLAKECPVWVLAAPEPKLLPHSDQNVAFRQDRYFFYLLGCHTPLARIIYDTRSDRLVLYLPPIDEEDVMWSGMPELLEHALLTYDVDEVKYSTDMKSDVGSERFLSSDVAGGLDMTTENAYTIPSSELTGTTHPDFMWALDESRLIKDEHEIMLMRKAAVMTDRCHLAVMQATPIETNETHMHAEFAYHALRQGCKNTAYDPICCSGTACSTLHWIKNDQPITPEKRLVFIDAGCEYECYASDVTRCFPVNGDWTKEHLDIYKAVLRMQSETLAMMKVDAHWDDLHLHAHRILIEEFLKLGIFKLQYQVQEIFDSKILARFFPHGLGHLLGMDTHDVGGRPNYDDPNPMLRYLRMRRELKAGMVITNEPGIYFSPFLLEDVLQGDQKKFINVEILNKYWYMGGVRIEDDILITKDGYENFTSITLDWKEILEIVKNSKDRTFHNVI